MKLRPKIKLWPKFTTRKLKSAKRLMWLTVIWNLTRRNSRLLSKLNSSLTMRLKSWPTSSRSHMRKLKNSRRITKTLSMREISLVLNSLEEMMSWLCFMRRSKFSKTPLPEVRSNIKKGFKTSDFWNSKLVITRVNLELLSLKLLRFQILERKSTVFSSSFWLKDFRLRPFLKSLKILWISTDGESSKVLIQILGKCFRKSQLSKRDWSRRLKKLLRKTSLSKRRRNCTLNSRTFLLDNQVLKLPNSFRSTSKTWRRKLVKWKQWLLSSTCTKLKSTSTSMKSKDWPENSKTWRESTTSKREESRCKERLNKDWNQELLTKPMLQSRDLLVEVSTLPFEISRYSKDLNSEKINN